MNRRKFINTSVLASCAIFITPSKGQSIDTKNIDTTGKLDSTDGLQNLLDEAASLATVVPNGIQKVLVQLGGVIKITKPLIIDASRVNIIGPATLFFSGNVSDYDYGIKLHPDSSKNVSYTNGVGSFFESINFFAEKKIDLFYASNLKTPGSNPSCLLNISQCRFTGFAKVFVNGAGGWGWNWDRCGFDQCDYLLYLTQKMDSYERFTFNACIWQNGGVAFYVDNPYGKIYWNSGSFDYCKAIAHINRGYVSVSGHLEFHKRTEPVVIMKDSQCGFTFSGGSIFIAQNEKEYYLFEQNRENQLILRDINILYDKVVDDSVIISNMSFIADNIFSVNRKD